ncbi:MarR family winged helix-turn-helix transcriptional regulator [Shewanella youngdeokensis]|uniref:MarR family transcriptional regulator n=1 Tax=Shewanella youngdeokensis TaxID=2999068 RepID=A0ABZ0K3U0_9GAMM|nr:MarR family transcriptional regulator [Shewanella sp. DAU334]
MKSQDNDINHAIIEFYEKLSSWEATAVKSSGFSLPQVHTVEILGLNGPMRMKPLAEKMGVTTGTLTVQIDKMVKADLVVRRSEETDRRAVLVDLSATGHELFEEHNKLHVQLTSNITKQFSDSECTQLLDFFKRINQTF